MKNDYVRILDPLLARTYGDSADSPRKDAETPDNSGQSELTESSDDSLRLQSTPSESRETDAQFDAPKYRCRKERKCSVCGGSFVSYNPNPQFCSRACRSEFMRTPVDEFRLRTMYEQGFTQDEIAELMGVSQKAIWGAMRRIGVKSRVAAKRYQVGEANDSWKGVNANYKTSHARVASFRGKPKRCDVCGTTDPTKTYQWANLTKRYHDPFDYKRMCKSCHATFDGIINNIKKMRKGVAREQ